MTTVLFSDYENEIMKYEKVLNLSIEKLKEMKINYMTSSVQLKTAEDYIEKLKTQIHELKEQPKKMIKITGNSEKYLEQLKTTLELSDLDVKKITQLYIAKNKYY
jgi:succinate dehydrogenase/fumarate reductase flavoprotein subunit